MIRNTLKQSKNFLLKNHKFIRLVFFIAFGKLLYTIILLAYNVNNLLIYRFNKGWSTLSTIQYLRIEVQSHSLVWLVILLAIIVLVWYVFLYPSGMAATIHFLKDKKNNIGKSIWKWIWDFFAMFELNALSFSFWIYTYAITVLRLFTLWILNSNIAIILVVVRWLVVLFASIFWQYAKFILVMEKKHEKDEDEKIWIFDAIKKSISLSINHIGITFRWWIMQIITWIWFYIKTFVIIAIPLLVIYFLVNSNINTNGFEWLIRIISGITTILTIYMFSMIQAFFRKSWFDIYQTIKTLEENED